MPKEYLKEASTIKTYSAKLEIDMNAIRQNINKIKNKIGNNKEIMLVIKDNGYGTYINTQIEFLKENNINHIGVAITDEGVEMRKLGYNEGYLYPHDFPGHYVEQQYLPDEMVGTKYFVKDENIDLW